MKVFNLTSQPIAYKGKTIPPFGSSDFDVQNLSDRDGVLQAKGMLAFGSLPKGWKRPEPAYDQPAPVEIKPILPVSTEEIPLEVKPKEEKSDFKKKRV